MPESPLDSPDNTLSNQKIESTLALKQLKRAILDIENQVKMAISYLEQNTKVLTSEESQLHPGTVKYYQ
ncbi:MAG: hypothetical protein ACRCXC_00970 [Legionella sp.]